MTSASGSEVVGRLAPSPTGVLHLGNARTFLLAWLSVRSRGGTLLLRIEDIDGPRVKADASEQTIEDLRWLGLDWDGEVVVQSQRGDVYRAAADRLVAAGQAETGRDAALRFCVDVDTVPFVDGFRGPQVGAIAGDFVVQKRDGDPAYQLAVVVDDAAQGVSEVLRADDLLPSTPRQLLLYRALGLAPPCFVHVPLVVGPDGLRLAKRHGNTSLRHLRRLGVSPQDLVGHLAVLCGLRERRGPCSPSELLDGFDLSRLPPDAVRGDDHALIG